MKDKISVIVPCYRVENYIDRCLKSLEEQTYGLENMEMILIDDASGDETYDHLLRFEAKYPENVLVVACKDNAGPGTTRNIGLKYATGEYISFVDADDAADSAMLERMYNAIREFGVDVVECGYRAFADGDELRVEKRDSGRLMWICTPEDRGRFILNSFRTAVWGRLYQKRFLEENALFFPETILYGEDNLFSGLAMLLCGSCYYVGDTLYHYYQNADGLIRKRNDDGRIRQLADVMELYLTELDSRGFLDGAMTGYGVEFEWYMIYKYFMDPVSFVISRQMLDWKEQVGFFREKLLQYFPDAGRNPYLNRDKRWADYVFLLNNDR